MLDGRDLRLPRLKIPYEAYQCPDCVLYILGLAEIERDAPAEMKRVKLGGKGGGVHEVQEMTSMEVDVVDTKYSWLVECKLIDLRQSSRQRKGSKDR